MKLEDYVWVGGYYIPRATADRRKSSWFVPGRGYRDSYELRPSNETNLENKTESDETDKPIRFFEF